MTDPPPVDLPPWCDPTLPLPPAIGPDPAAASCASGDADDFGAPLTPEEAAAIPGDGPEEPADATADPATAAAFAPHLVVPPDGWGPQWSVDRWYWMADAAGKLAAPKRGMRAYIDIRLKGHKLHGGEYTAYDAVTYYLTCVHRVCGLGAISIGTWGDADVRYLYGTPRQVHDASVAFQSFGHPGVGGVYYACRYGVPDVLLGVLRKEDHKTPLSLVNVARSAGYSTGVRYGWWGLQDTSSPKWAMRNPNLSGPFRFGLDDKVPSVGLAGHDLREVVLLRSLHGVCSGQGGWVGRIERAFAR